VYSYQCTQRLHVFPGTAESSNEKIQWLSATSLATSNWRCPTTTSPCLWSAWATRCGTQLALPVVGRNRGVAQHNHGVGDAADLDTAEGVRWAIRHRAPIRHALAWETQVHCEVPVGIKYPLQSLLSEAAAKPLGKVHQFLDRLLSRNFVVMSQSRRAVCSSRSGSSHQRRVGVMTGWRSKSESKTLANALLGGNLKLKFAESSLPRNFYCFNFEKFCQQRLWAIWRNSSGKFTDIFMLLRNLHGQPQLKIR